MSTPELFEPITVRTCQRGLHVIQASLTYETPTGALGAISLTRQHQGAIRALLFIPPTDAVSVGGICRHEVVGLLVCDGMSERRRYPSDWSDEQRSLIEPVIREWKDRHRSVSGQQGSYDMREIVNAILYRGRTGCQ